MIDKQPWSSFLDAPRIVHPPPGPRSRALLADQARWETDAIVYPHYFPLAPKVAQGATIEDVDGNRYIDWLSGICVFNLGHRHPRVVAAVEEQARAIWHTLELPTETRIRFLREVRDSLPGTLRNRARIFFCVTGGDSIETAVSLADFAQHKRGTVAFSGAYHGIHGGVVHLTSGRRYHSTTSFPRGPVIRVPYPDPYRPVLGADEGAAGTISYLEHLLNDPSSGVDEVSSILVEPILGEGGYVVPPDDFLPSLRELCDRHGILLIADEVQTGLGRTGRMWAVEHSGVTPDILCMAKTIGGGLPLSVVAYREDLVDELPPGFHVGTFRANPLALAAGAEILKVLREGDLIERTRQRGPPLLGRFREIAERYPAIGQVRGRGFMVGVELVRDRTSRLPWGERARAMRSELLSRGVLMHTAGAWDQVLRFMAPLMIEEELLERGLGVFEESMKSLSSPRSASDRPAGSERRPAGSDAPREPSTRPLLTPSIPKGPRRGRSARAPPRPLTGRRN